ncbi:MAG: DUF2318 domain-containing protein [Desulfobacteraceae bacterium]|nr:DUF2318 domain-containing protein [Desulfobacteraceae bacterium]
MSQKKTENSKKSPRERFQKDNHAAPKQRNKILFIIPALVVVGLIAFFAGSFLFKNNSHNPGAVMASTDITYPASQFADGRARHFKYDTDDGMTIRYFILKSADGIIRAAFDACDVCWPANKGYYQEGDYMVCRNCGRKFASVKVNEVKGGCNPAPLNRQATGDKVVIQIADILNGKRYFNFSTGGQG